MNRTSAAVAPTASPAEWAPLSRPLSSLTRSATGRPLPERLRGALEALSGLDLGDVRVHRGSPLPALLEARAFAYGEAIYLGPGAEDALAHEAWHVVQQKQGRVRATGVINGIALNDDTALEAEADTMAARAERWSGAGATEGGRRVARVARPVAQRWIIIQTQPQPTHLLGAQGLRTMLEDNYHLAQDRTISRLQKDYLFRACQDVIRTNATYPSLQAVRQDVKRRAFGKAHAAHMRRLWLAQDAIKQTLTPMQVKRFAGAYKNASPQTLNDVYVRKGQPPFLLWTIKTDYIKARKPETAHFRQSEMFRWVSGDATLGREPRLMNCWEAVIYGGGWAVPGRRGVYDRNYAFWALRTVRMPQATYGPNAGVEMRTAFFVEHIVQNAIHHSTRLSPDAVGGRPGLPATIPAGTIVVFSCGSHVALVTGNKMDNEDGDAIAAYGRRGHEILELDGSTSGLQRGTIEDHLVADPRYAHEIHLGWLPEKPAAENVTMNEDVSGNLICQVNVPRTHFYD